MLDIAAMPGHNPKAASRGERSVSEGHVKLGREGKLPGFYPRCVEHGAMLCVNEERTIWRCIACGAGAFLSLG